MKESEAATEQRIEKIKRQGSDFWVLDARQQRETKKKKGEVVSSCGSRVREINGGWE